MDYKVIEPPASFSLHSYTGDLQGCGTIRIIFPNLLLNHLRIPGYVFHSSYNSNFINDPGFYKNHTIVQFQRASTENHLKIINHYITNIKKIVKTPVIYEIDDLLIGVPEWNRAADYYDKYKDSIEKIMSVVNGITVSTNKLKEIYSKYNNNIQVIPNHLPRFIWGDVTYNGYQHYMSSRNSVKPRILYQGSDNHFCTRKLQERGLTGGDFGNTILDYIRKTTDKYQWVFMGGFPLEIDDLIKAGKVEYHGWKNIFEYPAYIKSLNVDLCIAVLQYNEFNESKSNIKNLEYVALGVPAIYTDIEPYKHTANKAKTDEEMIAHIEKLCVSPDLCYESWKKDYETVKDNLFWETNDNVKKYVNSYLALFGKVLK